MGRCCTHVPHHHARVGHRESFVLRGLVVAGCRLLRPGHDVAGFCGRDGAAGEQGVPFLRASFGRGEGHPQLPLAANRLYGSAVVFARVPRLVGRCLYQRQGQGGVLRVLGHQQRGVPGCRGGVRPLRIGEEGPPRPGRFADDGLLTDLLEHGSASPALLAARGLPAPHHLCVPLPRVEVLQENHRQGAGPHQRAPPLRGGRHARHG
mmetsp:Transcript_63744/g.201618  ORF Transcript_63744/g.201618 Transcript_63744/m.201618 type:complete len:207 (-) Transcript_63744:2244-2864(-)